MDLKFRDLRSDEIECKVSTVTEKGLSLLLYNTARADMQLLDETVGAFNWKCEYQEIKNNLYCGISIFDEDKKEWITKWDCGVESAFGDKEKGEASDSFKRAGFKWGIGRFLYTSPFIWIPNDRCNIKDSERKDAKGNKIFTCSDKFIVEAIEIKDKEITGLAIKNMNVKNEKGQPTRVFIYRKGE